MAKRPKESGAEVYREKIQKFTTAGMAMLGAGIATLHDASADSDVSDKELAGLAITSRPSSKALHAMGITGTKVMSIVGGVLDGDGKVKPEYRNLLSETPPIERQLTAGPETQEVGAPRPRKLTADYKPSGKWTSAKQIAMDTGASHTKALRFARRVKTTLEGMEKLPDYVKPHSKGYRILDCPEAVEFLDPILADAGIGSERKQRKRPVAKEAGEKATGKYKGVAEYLHRNIGLSYNRASRIGRLLRVDIEAGKFPEGLYRGTKHFRLRVCPQTEKHIRQHYLAGESDNVPQDKSSKKRIPLSDLVNDIVGSSDPDGFNYLVAMADAGKDGHDAVLAQSVKRREDGTPVVSSRDRDYVSRRLTQLLKTRSAPQYTFEPDREYYALSDIQAIQNPAGPIQFDYLTSKAGTVLHIELEKGYPAAQVKQVVALWIGDDGKSWRLKNTGKQKQT